MDDFFTSEEKKELFSLYRHLMQSAGDSISWRDCQKLKKHLIKAAQCNGLQRNNFGMNPVIRDLQTAVIVAEEIGMKGSCLIGIMLHEIVKAHILSIEDVNIEYGEDVGSIIKGLVKTNELYSKSPAIESENFRNLLLSFAEDMRVILIMIADRVNVMRQIKDTGNEDSGSAIIRYETGMHVVYSQNFFARKGAGLRGARFLGYDGTVEFDFQSGDVRVYMHHVCRTETYHFNVKDGHGGGDEELCRNFADVVAGRALSRSSLRDGILSVNVCLAAKESSDKHQFVKIRG